MADTETPAPDTDSSYNENLFHTITLSRHFKRGKMVITKISLRKPNSGELRGIKLQDLFNTETDAILKLIPRISDPVLTLDECNKLPASDLIEIAVLIRGFFMSPEDWALMQTLAISTRNAPHG